MLRVVTQSGHDRFHEGELVALGSGVSELCPSCIPGLLHMSGSLGEIAFVCLNHRQRQMLTHWRSFWSHANSLEQLVSRGDALFDDQVRVSDLLQQIECLLAIASLDGMPQGI